MTEPNTPSRKKTPDANGPSTDLRPRNPNFWLFLALLAISILFLIFNLGPPRSEIREDTFLSELGKGNVVEVTYVAPFEIVGTFKTAPDAPPVINKDGTKTQQLDKHKKPRKLYQHFSVSLDAQMSNERKQDLERLYDKFGVAKQHQYRRDNSTLLVLIVSIAIPLALLFVLWTMFRKTRDQLMGGGFLSGFTKSPAKRFEQGEPHDDLQRRGRSGGRETGLDGAGRISADPEKIPATGWSRPQGRTAERPPRHRQDAAGTRSGRRSARAVLFRQRL